MITIQKGNLFNHLDQRLDCTLLDSNQYDLKLIVDDVPTFYRIRFNGKHFHANEIEEPSTFQLPKYSKQADIDELSSFYQSMYYIESFPYQKIFDSIKRKSGNGVEDYYAYLKKITGKSSVSSEKIYDFRIPFNKRGVNSIEITIELIRKKYYLIFIKEHAQKGYFQTDCTLYSIFDRKDFLYEKNKLEETVLELCIQYDYPIGLATFLLVICNQDLDLLKQLMDLFLLARSKQEMNILLTNQIYAILEPTLRHDPDIEHIIRQFVSQETEDLNYQFKKKKRD